MVIHHGVDHEGFAPGGDEGADLDALAGVGVAPPYVAFLGTIEPRKNIPGLIDAFARVAPRHAALRLVLAGGGGWGDDAVTHAIARVASRTASCERAFCVIRSCPRCSVEPKWSPTRRSKRALACPRWRRSHVVRHS